MLCLDIGFATRLWVAGLLVVRAKGQQVCVENARLTHTCISL